MPKQVVTALIVAGGAVAALLAVGAWRRYRERTEATAANVTIGPFALRMPIGTRARAVALETLNAMEASRASRPERALVA